MIGGLKIISVIRLYLLIILLEKKLKYCVLIKVIFLLNCNF